MERARAPAPLPYKHVRLTEDEGGTPPSEVDCWSRVETALNEGNCGLGHLEGHARTPHLGATTLWSGQGLLDSRVGVCEDLLVSLPTQLLATSDTSARALTIAEGAHRTTAQFTTNRGPQGMLGPVLDHMDDQENRSRTLSGVNQSLATKNANLEATMKQVTKILVTLLKEPIPLATPPPPSQSGVSRSGFNIYVAKAAVD